ncbi:class I SAM-dependent methyltransferase [Effusibacillus consociatus]|uniref:Class I SAM-dependent methyltransferase n=1 Tax=Effusibacillus consociatus TaxID=1117041 RepID=A0ABV9PZP3_9BACL
MNFHQFIDLIANHNVTDEQIENELCENHFYLTDIQEDLADDVDEIILIETKRRKCSVIHAKSGTQGFPCVQTGTKKVLYILQGKIQYSEYVCDAFTLTNTKKEIASVGEVIIVNPGVIHKVAAYDAKAIVLTVSLSNVDYDDTRIFNHSFKIFEDNSKLPDYYYGYDERYQKVYAEGADLWETDQPNEPLIQFVERYLVEGKRVIDLGCGEGRDSVYLVSQGYDVYGVDVSRAALEKARMRARQLNLNCKFIERDVVYLRNIKNESFDAAINMGCLHMMPDPVHRKQHLERVFQILKPGGYFLVAHCRGEWLKGFFSVPNYEEAGPAVPGRIINRRIRVKGGTKMIPLPLVPFKESSEEELKRELAASGFKVVDSLSENTDAFGNTAVLLAQKP